MKSKSQPDSTNPTIMPSRRPYLSAIVCVYNGASHIGRCVDALLLQDYPCDCCEIIVVDDGSVDDTSRVLDSYGTKIKVIRHSTNHGLGAARNTAVAQAIGEIVCFTDSDCEPDRAWLSSFAALFTAFQHFAGIGGAVVAASPATATEHWYAYTPGTAGSHQIRRRGASSALRALGLVRGQLPDDGDELRVIQGANSAFRRTDINEVGGWNSAIRFGGEDVEFSLRLLQTGRLQRYSSRPVVQHYHRTTLRAFVRHAFAYGLGGGRLRKRSGEPSLPALLTFPARIAAIIAVLGATAYMFDSPAPLICGLLPTFGALRYAHRVRQFRLWVCLPLLDICWRTAHWFGGVYAVGEYTFSQGSPFLSAVEASTPSRAWRP